MNDKPRYQRRDFMRRVGTAGVALLASPALGAGEPPLRLEDFTSLLGRTFRLGGESGEVTTARLVEAAGHGPAPKAGFRRPFALLFELPGGGRLPQGVYRVSVAGVGVVPMLLVPVDMAGGGRRGIHLRLIPSVQEDPDDDRPIRALRGRGLPPGRVLGAGAG